MVLRYAHLAPEHPAEAASRAETPWETVADHATVSLRQAQVKAKTEL
jgi:hypothetical protein